MRTELAESADLPQLLALVEAKTYPESHFPGVTAESRRKSDVEALTRDWKIYLEHPGVEVRVLRRDLQVVAFAISLVSRPDHATGQLETVVVEHAGSTVEYSAMLNELAEAAQLRGDRYLALRCYAEEKGLADSLTGSGFAPEFSRVVRVLEASSQRCPADLVIRPATMRDRPFLAGLHVEYSSFYQSSHRDDAEWSTFQALENYLQLDFGQDSNLRGWVAWMGREPLGYVLVKNEFELDQPTEPAAYLYDIAVARGSWGRLLGGLLHEWAAAALFEAGKRLIVGDIAWHNGRTLIYASRRLGYRTEWVRWGKNLPAQPL